MQRLATAAIFQAALPHEIPVLTLLALTLVAAVYGSPSGVPVPWAHDRAPADSFRFARPALPGSSELYFRLGTDLERQGRWALAAAAYLAGARCHGPLRCYCRVGLARSLLALGRPEGVPSLLDAGQLPVSLRAPAALLRAWALLDQGAWDRALSEIHSARELAPPVHREAAVAEALGWIGLGLPDSARSVLLRSTRGELLGPWAGRACRLLEALAAGPDSISLLDLTAAVHERRGDLDRAADHWRMRVRTAQGRDAATARLKLARVLRSQRRTAEARAILEDLLHGPWRWEAGCPALWELARCALKDGDDEDIATAHGEYARRCPQGAFVGDAVWHRARAIERLGDYEGARELYQVLGRSEATDFGEECLFRQALCYYVERDHLRAVALFDSLSLAHPGPRNYYWLGKALERTGALASAESCFGLAACQGARPSYYSVRAAHRLSLGGVSIPAREWCRSTDLSVALLDPAAARSGDHGPVPWSRIRSHLDRAGSLLRVGMRDYAGQECEWAVRRSENHPVVRAIAIKMLEQGMAYRQSMQAAHRWWCEESLAELVEYLYPRAYRGIVARACRESDVDSCLLWAVMREESWFDPEAVSRAGAVGLMQLMPHTAESIAEGRSWSAPSDLRDPDTNIQLGAAHLSDLLREFPFMEAALAAYNAGRGPARRWLGLARVRDRDTFVESITYGETRSYVQRVGASYAFYRSRSGGANAARPWRLRGEARVFESVTGPGG